MEYARVARLSKTVVQWHFALRDPAGREIRLLRKTFQFPKKDCPRQVMVSDAICPAVHILGT